MTFSNKLNNAVAHPFENRLVLIGESRKPNWFDIPTSSVRSTIPVEVAEFFDSIAIARNGALLAVESQPGPEPGADWHRVALVDVASNRKLYSLPTIGLEPTDVVWLPDDLSLAATLRPQHDWDPYLIVWHLSDPHSPHVRVPAGNPP